MRGFFTSLAVLVVSMLAGPVFAQPDLDPQVPVDSKITVGKLENGLTYYIRPNSRPENRAELRLDSGRLQPRSASFDQQRAVGDFRSSSRSGGSTGF